MCYEVGRIQLPTFSSKSDAGRKSLSYLWNKQSQAHFFAQIPTDKFDIEILRKYSGREHAIATICLTEINKNNHIPPRIRWGLGRLILHFTFPESF